MNRLSISHKTEYRFTGSPTYGLQQIRLIPKTNVGQTAVNWKLSVKGGDIQADFFDHHNNHVYLVALPTETNHIEIISEGLLEIENNHGIIGLHKGFTPLWYFRSETKLTKTGKLIKALLASLPKPLDHDPQTFHALSNLIASRVTYQTGTTEILTAAEDALHVAKGVCQDHAHIFIAAVRHAGFAARYVSGYLMMNDRITQEATHAWAEVYIHNLGWVGFDVSNGISPDERYVRVATGLDYKDAAPISGVTFGGSGESLTVSLDVQQQ